MNDNDIEAIYELSPMQQGMLFDSLYDIGSGGGVVQLRCKLQGELDASAFESAWQQVIDRHPVLRTAFFWEEFAKPLQVVYGGVKVSVRQLDWRDIDHTQSLDEFLQDDLRAGFDLSEPPLVRLHLIRLDEKNYQFVWSYHHGLLDGWTGPLLLKEIRTFYEAVRRGQKVQLPKGRPYRDYITWLQQQDVSKAEEYWRQTLKGFTGPTPLMEAPSTNEAAPEVSYGLERARLSSTATTALHALCRQHRLTFNTLVQGAWALLLHKHSGETDVCFGATVSGRPADLAGVESMVGLFINTLPVRVRVRRNEKLLPWLRQLQEQQVEARQYEYSPLVQVAGWSEVPKGLPLFSSLVVFENYPIEESAPNQEMSLRVSDVRSIERTNFPLTIVAALVGTELSLQSSYDSKRFEQDQIQRMLGHLQTILEAMAAQPNRRVADYTLLTQAEYQQIVKQWNETDWEFPRNRCVHQLFDERALATPDNIALDYEGQQLTYRELNERANQLGHYLQRLGVGPDVLVGLCVEPSVEMIVGMLGIMKAGGAYVPLDPEYPLARLALMIEDSQMPVLVTKERWADDLPADCRQIICLDAQAKAISAESPETKESNATPDNLAYVIYTSGSTGRPKGTMLAHRGLCNLALSQVKLFGYSATSRVLQFASLSFDASAFEIFITLLSGGTLCLAAKDSLLPGAPLVETLRERSITTVTLPPSVLAVLPSEQLPALQNLIVAGEACTSDVVSRWSEGRNFIDAYGPTEATVCASAAQLTNGQKPVIGRPIANMRLYILDEELQPVPVGAKGELHIGGVGLARGYLNAPGLTAERFIPDPFSEHGGERLYKTGDIAVYQSNGDIEFVGRSDQQVKLRGYRIELGEIEELLNQHSSVRKSIVTVRESQDNDKSLVVYLVPNEEHLPANAEQQPGGARLEIWPSVAEYFVYDDLIYYALTNDERRNEKYRAAINRSVKDKVVVDIGTGKDAILARFCIEAGAKKVYAIETLDESYQQARVCIKKLGLEDRIVLLHGDAMTVELPEKAHVCVSEIVGSIGGSEGAALLLKEARRFLVDGGLMIPGSSTTRIAAVCLPDELLRNPAFNEVSGNYVKKIFDQIGYQFDMRLCLKGLGPSDLISNVDVFEQLDFNDQLSTEFSHEVRFTIDRKSRLDGFLLWLNLETIAGESLDILKEAHAWLPVYFPVFSPGIDVDEGDRLLATCSGWLSSNNVNPDYRIYGKLLKRTGEVVDFDFTSSHHGKAFRANGFYRKLFSGAEIKIKKSNREQAIVNSLRTYFAERLPDYMVPAHFVLLHEFPVTPNGKIDRAALPSPAESLLAERDDFVAPSGPVEGILAGIWEEVLNLKRVGIHDNFFELGGHSLLATRVVSRVREAFGVDIPLRGLFDQPTVAELRASIEKELGREDTAPAIPLARASRENSLPLSFAQQRLFFLDRLKPGSTVYNVPAVVHVAGALNVTALAQALNDIIQRHEALRTSFPTVDGEPVQWINPSFTAELPVVDLSALAPESREPIARRLATLEAQRPFDLSTGPLIRTTLLNLDQEEHIALITMHHIISDMWSMSIFMRELASLYKGFVEGQPPVLTDLPIQYADYAVWQRRWLRGAVLEQQLAYWKQQLAEAPIVLELPTDRPRPSVQRFQGAIQNFALSPKLSEAARQLSRREGTTLFMTLLAVFQTLLYRYSGQTDIVVGSPIAGRNQVETEDLIGFFVNTLVLRSKLAANMSFQQLVAQVREVTLAAYAHQDVPFDRLVEEIQPERDLGHAPMVQVVFALQTAPVTELHLPGLRLSSLSVQSGAAKYDLILSVADTPEGLVASVEYNTDLFESATIQRMMKHFGTLLEAVAESPEQTLSELRLLTREEERQIISEWNETFNDSPRDKCIQQLIESQVERSPEATALIFGRETLSYGALNRKANQLARHLQALGVKPETRVAMMMERSIEMVVAILAILKAGATYLPLDPSYPLERLSFILQDAQAQILLTQQALKERSMLPVETILCVDTESSHLPEPPEKNVESSSTPDNSAYLVYTSGSTGTPKGVLVSQRALVNRVLSMIQIYELDQASRQFQFVSPAFDAFAEELFPTLVSGGALVVHPNPTALTPGELLGECERAGVTVLHIPPAYWHQLVEEVSTLEPMLDTLKLFITGGESSSVQRLAKLAQLTAYRCRFVNAYGPTEATITATAYEAVMESKALARLPKIPIGRPLANTRTYVRDSEGQPVPIGVAGELYIGGINLAVGYLNNADMTAERFVPDPFSEEPGARLYRTGDLARYLADGNIEYLGRLDEQVKIRGFRVELEEIASVLRQHPSVNECVVIASDSGAGDKTLIAYFTSEQATDELETELRNYVKQKLPHYMVPTDFVWLEYLPINPNGKVDRVALPAPNQARAKTEGNFCAPRTTVERVLANIWVELLGVERVGVNNNFFELGGHSMLAVRLMARIQELFGQELPLSALFQSPTIEHLGQILEQEGESQPWSHLVAIQPNGSKPPFFCVHPAGGQVFCYYQLSRHLGNDQPFYAFEAQDFLTIGENGEKYNGIEERASIYLDALQLVQPMGPYLIGGWSFGGIVAFEMAQQLKRRGEEVALLAIIDSIAPIISTELDDAKLLVGFALEAAAQSGRSLALTSNQLAGLKPDEQIDCVVERLRQADVLPADMKQEIALTQARRVLQGSKLRSQSITSYVPQQYGGPITVFTAELNPGWSEDGSVSEIVKLYQDPTKGWSAFTTAPVRAIAVPGYHATLLFEPHVCTLAQRLRTCIEEVNTSSHV